MKIFVKGGLVISIFFSHILLAIAAIANSFLYILYLAEFEEISLLYWGIKQMVRSQTLRSIINL